MLYSVAFYVGVTKMVHASCANEFGACCRLRRRGRAQSGAIAQSTQSPLPLPLAASSHGQPLMCTAPSAKVRFLCVLCRFLRHRDVEVCWRCICWGGAFVGYLGTDAKKRGGLPCRNDKRSYCSSSSVCFSHALLLVILTSPIVCVPSVS